MYIYDKDYKIIYSAYKLFYNKEPNFSKDNIRNITIEIQSMAYILSLYGITIVANRFVKDGYKGLELPMSMDIQDIIVDKLLENKENIEEELVQFSDEVTKEIYIIGDIANSIIDDTEDRIETLRKIVYISFTKRRVILDDSDDKIKEIANCEDIDLKLEKNLFERINHDLCNDSYNYGNIYDIEKAIKNSRSIKTVGMFVKETGNGCDIIPTEESRSIITKSLLR